MLSLQAADSEGNEPDILKLKRLYEVVVQSQELVNGTLQMEQAVQDQSDAVDSQQQMNNEQNAQMQTSANIINNAQQMQ